MKRYFVSVALALFALNAAAAVTKWVDANGKVHYSDTPPPDVTTETVQNVTGKEPADATPAYTPKSYIEREAEWKKSRQAKEEAAKKQAEKDKQAEARKSNCEAARENARVLQDSPRISTVDESGNRVFMDDATRAQKLDDARKAISDNCN
jgi:Domain of unknown function (DUF4124)